MSQAEQAKQATETLSASARFLAALGATQGQSREPATGGLFASLLAETQKSFCSLEAMVARTRAQTQAPQEQATKQNNNKTADDTATISAPDGNNVVDTGSNAPEPEREEDAKTASESMPVEGKKEAPEKAEVTKTEKTQRPITEAEENETVRLAVDEDDQGQTTEESASIEDADNNVIILARPIDESGRRKENIGTDTQEASLKEGDENEDETAQLDATVIQLFPEHNVARGKKTEIGTDGKTEKTKTNAAEASLSTGRTPAFSAQPEEQAQEAVPSDGSKESSQSKAGAAKATETAQTAASSATPSSSIAQDPYASHNQDTARVFAQVLATGQAPGPQSVETTAATSGAQNATVGKVGQASATTSQAGIARTLAETAPSSQLVLARASQVKTTAAVEQIAVQVSKFVKEGETEITINLKPPELGRVQVKLEFSADNRVQALVMADSQSALDLLMKEQNSLARALTDAGLQLDSGAMEFSLNENGQNALPGEGRFDSSSGGAGLSENDGDDGLVLAASEDVYGITPGRVNIRV